MWLATGALGLLTAGLAVALAAKQSKKTGLAVSSALVFTVLTLLLEYRQVYRWVMQEDWSALMDVVPTMHNVLCGYVILVFLGCAAALALGRRSR